MSDKQSQEYYALIHTAIPDKKVYQIPGAKAAIDKEWDKLFKFGTFDLSIVAEKHDVAKRYKLKNEKVHFGTLRTLCHEKHCELPLHLRKYKGRVVFRGDIAKDEDGWYAVFSEQGTSSSHMAATKFLDAIAHAPGNSGEDSDAVGAYIQILQSDAGRISGIGVIPETWISLPPSRHSKDGSWANIKDPVCPLTANFQDIL